MNYYFLNQRREQLLFIKDKTDRDNVINNLLKLRADLAKNIPEKKLSGNLILGTWNIREFGNSKYGGRMTESLYYIAETISRFDLIAIQEVRDDLRELNMVCQILGNDWGIFISVVTQGGSGNKERLAFIYDKRTVSFRNIAGQVVLPQAANQSQFARQPYVIRFQSGWVKFDICTVHIYYGKATKNSLEYQRRVSEIKNLVDFFNDYYVNKGEANNIFILGDFNIENTQSKTYEAATSSVFHIPSSILKNKLKGSNVAQDKIYDQILYFNKYNDITFKNAGIFNFYDSVFNSFTDYDTRIQKHYKITATQFDDFKTYQMSDHLPLWIEMNTDHTEQYLEYLKTKLLE